MGELQVKLSKKKRNAFLKALVLHGGLAQKAAEEVGYRDTSFLRRVRSRDEGFAELWDEAIEAAGDLVEAEVYRRAIHGVMEPVYYKGEICGYVKKHSDRLAEVLLKRHKPEYRDGSRGSDISINVGIALMPARAKNSQQWEERSIEMHSEQQPIVLEDKPKENMLERTTVKRGD